MILTSLDEPPFAGSSQAAVAWTPNAAQGISPGYCGSVGRNVAGMGDRNKLLGHVRESVASCAVGQNHAAWRAWDHSEAVPLAISNMAVERSRARNRLLIARLG
jgi:hypothetical protein